MTMSFLPLVSASSVGIAVARVLCLLPGFNLPFDPAIWNEPNRRDHAIQGAREPAIYERHCNGNGVKDERDDFLDVYTHRLRQRRFLIVDLEQYATFDLPGDCAQEQDRPIGHHRPSAEM